MALIIRKGRVTVLAGAAATATLLAGMAAGTAQAAVIGVQQVPATGIVANSFGDWRLYTASIRIDTGSERGEVKLSAPGGAQCSSYGVSSKTVRFDYTNVTTGKTGSGTVKPCSGTVSSVPTSVVLHPGSGQVIGTINISAEGGPWQIPGGATFTVG
ncbi:MAG: hypothetical protein QM774_02670 [Gordonia sp. (in: high G+C Gram-positive bacteria)]|uniref:hypothetical protein n=1 Tax=Gordonia sp. (in: high G+C Gram-positive bacteria) TaxID=84139 RepID=UPI0039E4779D